VSGGRCRYKPIIKLAIIGAAAFDFGIPEIKCK
jgi:hypothetical protein